MKDYLDLFVSFCVFMVMVVVILVGPFVGLSLIWNKNYCETMTQLNPQYTFQWELWGGCLIKIDNTYINANDYLNQTRQQIELIGEK